MRATERAGLLLAVVLLGASGAAGAHSRSVSYSDWSIDGAEVRATLRLPLAELNRAALDPRDAATAEAIAARVARDFELHSAGQACAPVAAQASIGADAVRVEARWRCASRPVRLRSRFLLDAVPGHVHLLQLHDGASVRGPWALGAAQTDADWSPQPAAPPQTLGRYLRLGTEHILSGWDHLAYLLVVLLGAATLPQLAWRVTGFTAGHSATLALATIGWVRPQATMVEAFIALTIVCTAAERVLAGHPRAALHAGLIALALGALGWLGGVLPLALVLAAVLLCAAATTPAGSLDGARTALFGLFHGFGFASALTTLAPNAALPLLPLLGFNLGVEVGQLLFVLPAWWLLQRNAPLRGPALPTVLLGLGSYWSVSRILA